MEKDKILREYRNESYNHLKKIAEHLYKNTLYDRKEDTIVSPVPIPGVAIRSSMNFTIYHDYLWELRNYLEEIFGLVSDDADDVWTYYKNKMREYDNRENSYHLTDEFMDSKDINRLDESTNNRKLVEKIAQEIINSTVIDADKEQLFFLPPIYMSKDRHDPIHLDVFSEWIRNDKSMGRYHLEHDIRKMGRQYIKNILGFGITQSDDPIYKEINDKVIKNVLHRALNWGGSDNQTFNLNESKEEKSKNYREKVYRDLVKKTKWRDDSYREIDVDGVCDKINSFIEWGSTGAYFYIIPPCIEDLLRNIYGLTYSEMDRFFWDWYGEHIIYMLISKKEYLPPHIKRLNLSYLNESKDARQGEFLNYVLEDLMNNTTWKDASYTILLLHGKNISTSINYDTFSIDWMPSKVDEILYNMGLDSREKRMIWEIYKEFVLDKMMSEGNNTWGKKHLHMRRYPYLNESVDSVEKNKPYLDKVVDKLKHYTTFIKQTAFNGWSNFYTAKVPFTGGQKWYIEWFSGSLETGYGFKDGFKKEMRDVYGLTPEEIEYVYMKFTSYLIKEFEGRQTKVHVVKD